MKVIFDDIQNDEELEKYLLMQNGINEVKIAFENSCCEITVTHDKKTTPEIIMKHINLFEKNKWPIILSFDKGQKENSKTFKHIVADLCCEYCYKGLVQDLFDNENIISVQSNFDFHETYNIEFTIGYKDNYTTEEILEYIKEKANI